MGLPVWRAPSPEESKDAIKVDLTASSRSSIRRRGQRSPVLPRRVRRLPNPHAAPATAPYSRSPRRGEFGFRMPSNWDFDSLGHSTARRDRDPTPLPPVPESRNYTRERAEGHSSARNLREFREYHEPAVHYFGLREPLPPASYSRELPSYTPNFAPAAYNPHSFTLSPERRSRTPPTRSGPPSRHSRHDFHVLVEDGDEESSDANPVGFPPLRRMGRRTIADGPLPSSSLRESWSPATTVDGLGDRERSFSPVDDHWDTMLSTVAPDPHLPSADSSFTSAAASASFSASHPSSRSASSNSNSASSSRTHLTIPSQHSPEPLLAGVCESSDEDSGASDTEASESSMPPLGPPTRNPARYSRVLRDRSDDAVRFVRNYYSVTSRAGTHDHSSYSSHHDFLSPPPFVDGPILDDTHIPESQQPTLEDADTLGTEPGLERLRELLQHLRERDDVPEEFWLSSGLRLGRLERLEREQNRLISERAQLIARGRERL